MVILPEYKGQANAKVFKKTINGVTNFMAELWGVKEINTERDITDQTISATLEAIRTPDKQPK